MKDFIDRDKNSQTKRARKYKEYFETKIKEIDPENKTIELEDAIFYGKSGGQPGDEGEIIADGQKIKVNETIKAEESIKNILENLNGLRKNQKIIARINWDKRYKYMRMHSALHLMCASISLGVTGGQIGYDKSRLDFNDPNKEIKKEELSKTKASKKTNSKEKIKKADNVDNEEHGSTEVKKEVEGNKHDNLHNASQIEEELLINEDLKKPRPKMMTFTPRQ